MMNKIIILNGPNLNLLGEREKEKYGRYFIKRYSKIIVKILQKKTILSFLYQSNIEGELIEEIQKSRKIKMV